MAALLLAAAVVLVVAGRLVGVRPRWVFNAKVTQEGDEVCWYVQFCSWRSRAQPLRGIIDI